MPWKTMFSFPAKRTCLLFKSFFFVMLYLRNKFETHFIAQQYLVYLTLCPFWRKLCSELCDPNSCEENPDSLPLCHARAEGRWLTVWIQVKSFNLFLLFNPSGRLSTRASLWNRWCAKAKFSQIKKRGKMCEKLWRNQIWKKTKD